jgi:hypothetical protein
MVSPEGAPCSRKTREETGREFKPTQKLFFATALLCAALVWSAQARASSLAASEEPKQRPLKVFLKSSLNPAYFQKEIAFVDYVQDEAEAQVLVELTSRPTESGEEFTMSFTGQKEYAGTNDVLKFMADMSKKLEETKEGLARLMKLGLMRYVSKTPVSSRIGITFLDEVKPTSVVDKWNFWVFSLSAETFLDGEKVYRDSSIYGNFSANRVTPEWKIRLSFGASSSKTTYTYGDETYESSRQSSSFSGLVVRSISDHWSVGAYLSLSSSTYNNIKMSISPAPAIEYDLFPYSQSTKKQLRFLYRLAFSDISYYDKTIYEKMRENLWNESLSVTLELKQPWGTISTSLGGSHYFQDFKKNRLTLDGELSLRIIKGLNFNVYGGGSRIRDQLGLPMGEATKEDVLLQIRQLETTYNYYASVGISFSFGSIYSNVVNPRFGSGSGVSISFSY